MRISDWSSDVCSSDLRLRKQGAIRTPAEFVAKQMDDAGALGGGEHGLRLADIERERFFAHHVAAARDRGQRQRGMRVRRRHDRRDSGAAARDGIIEIGVAGDDAALLGTTRGTRGVGADQADDIETGGAQRRYMRTAAEAGADDERSEEHTSELQSLMRISYAVFCLKKKKDNTKQYKSTKKTPKTNIHTNTH